MEGMETFSVPTGSSHVIIPTPPQGAQDCLDLCEGRDLLGPSGPASVKLHQLLSKTELGLSDQAQWSGSDVK